MFTYKVYTSEEVIQVEQDRLEESLLYDIFQMHPDRTVYITESGKAAGIVTLGDFKRYIRSKEEIRFVDEPVQEKKKLVNTKFTSALVQEEREIPAFLEQKSIAFSIPVLDEQGRILREYTKEERGKKDFDVVQMLLQVYRETGFIRNKDIYIVVDHWSDEDAGLAEELKHKNIHIVTHLLVDELKQLKNQKSHYIYDFRYKFTVIVSYFYSDYQLNYSCLTDGMIHMIENVDNLFAHFESVGVLDINHCFVNKTALNIRTIDSRELVWNSQYNCYEYSKANMQKRPEVIYTVFPLSENPYVRWKESFVPFCAISQADFTVTCDSEHVTKVNDNDIALNIIPRLEKQGVKCIVLDNVQSRYSNWNKSLNIDSLQEEGKVCYHQLFQTIDRQNRWVAIYKNGYIQLSDVHMKDVTYRFGERCPEEVNDELNTIYIFGPCIVWGRYVSDKESIGYLLRKRIGDDFNVRSFGVGWNYMNYTIREGEYKSGDSIIVFAGDRQVYDVNHIPVFDIMDAWRSITDLKVHIRDLPYHCDGEVTRSVEEKIFQICKREGCLQRTKDSREKEKIHFGFREKRKFEIPQDLQEWLMSVQKEKVPDVKKAGAIVMI